MKFHCNREKKNERSTIVSFADHVGIVYMVFGDKIQPKTTPELN